MEAKLFTYDKPFTLESGVTLPAYHLSYTTYGKLNENKDNVVWIFHALTANSQPHEWWPGMVGENKIIDPKKYFIICVNKPGSPYGSISPLSVNNETKEKYYYDFPVFTIRDIVNSYKNLRDFLQINKVQIGMGGSTGGMQLLEWAVDEPDFFSFIVPIATNAIQSPWAIAFNASQRMAIEADGTWGEKKDNAGEKGLAAARSIALLSYRHYNGYALTQQREKTFTPLTKDVTFAADNYQRYQGKKLVDRFNAICYYRLTQTMDSHDVGRNRNGVVAALNRINAKTLIICIESDVLYPIVEMKMLQKNIRNTQILHLPSDFGHDGFLLENDHITKVLSSFLLTNAAKKF